MKRFTETEKWKDPWFRALSGPQKLVYLYVLDNCNNAGFYEVDEAMIVFQTGLAQNHVEGALKGLSRGLIGASGWLWVRRFLRHQKNEDLNDKNPAHKQIIALIHDQLERFKDSEEFRAFVAPLKGLLSPIGIGKGTSNGKRAQREGGTEHFPSFWQLYPNKVGKQNAEKAWRIQHCDDIAADVNNAVSRWIHSDKWKKDNGQFIPNPATWLNSGGWNDELPPTPGANHSNGQVGAYIAKSDI